MANEGTDAEQPEVPRLGEPGYFCIELFCGSGNLTYAMKHFFPDSFGVDHKVGKQRIKTICLDLSVETNQQLVEQWCLSGKCLWVHWGIPCGTASRARFRRLNRKTHGPPPLRSDRFPDGVPGLSGLNLVRVRLSNRLYAFMCRLIPKLHQSNIIWSVENPWTSLLWKTSYWRRLEKLHPWYCELHNCMFGGSRLKRTCLASNCSAIMSLAIKCDGQHSHAPWTIQQGVFDTSLEAEYTPALAKALAECILEFVAGEFKLPNIQQFSRRLKLSHFSAIAAAKQPTKPVSMALVPEFSHLIVASNIPQRCGLPVVDKHLAKCCTITCGDAVWWIPCGSKLLRQTVKEGGMSRQSKFLIDCAPSLQSISDSDRPRSHGVDDMVCTKGCSEGMQFHLHDVFTTERCSDWVFGAVWSPEQFLRQACSVTHPFDSFSGVPKVVGQACDDVANMKFEDIVNFRCSKLGAWLKLAAELKSEEAALKSSMSSSRRKILESKRLLLMKKVILDEGYEDVGLADDLLSGFSLVGDVPKSHVLPHKMSPSTLSTTDLQSNAAKANKALRFMTRSSGDQDLDQKLWERTQVELQRGWLLGPYSWDSLPTPAVVSRRFPISQSEKVRPIDDFSQSQINATVTSYEQATVDGPDVICALAVRLMRRLKDNGRSSQLVGRALDLASAYRQLAVAEDSYDFAFLSIFDPERREATLYRQVALPLGSVTAVNAFIRCSRFLQWAAGHCLKIPMSCYFDDFVVFSPPELASNSQAALSLMLDIFGWAFDREGPKRDDFSSKVSALGVVFNLGPTLDGRLEVHNTEKRLAEAVESLDCIITSGRLNKRDSLSLRGRLAFCDAFIFGRLGRVSLQSLTHHAYATPFNPHLGVETMSALKILRNRMSDAKPRCLDLNLLQTYVLMTDAAFDPGKGAGLGAVLVSPAGSVACWFGIQLSMTNISPLMVEGRQTVIGELETLAAAVALMLWGRDISSSKLLIFIDNEGARFSLIKGYSKAASITHICALASNAIDSYCIVPWYSRVPSLSNLADLPSRGVSHELLPSSLSSSHESVIEVVEECLQFAGKPERHL